MRILDCEKHMRPAISEALLAYQEGEIPVGAVVMRNGEIISAAHNLSEAAKDPSLHAELLAMRAALDSLGERTLSDCVLYSTLEPCAMCAGAAVHFGVKHIIFGAYDAQFGCCGSRLDIPASLTGGRLYVTGGVLESECEALLKKAFADMRNRR